MLILEGASLKPWPWTRPQQIKNPHKHTGVPQRYCGFTSRYLPYKVSITIKQVNLLAGGGSWLLFVRKHGMA